MIPSQGVYLWERHASSLFIQGLSLFASHQRDSLFIGLFPSFISLLFKKSSQYNSLEAALDQAGSIDFY
jgi:hypothetical protein